MPVEPHCPEHGRYSTAPLEQASGSGSHDDQPPQLHELVLQVRVRVPHRLSEVMHDSCSTAPGVQSGQDELSPLSDHPQPLLRQVRSTV